MSRHARNGRPATPAERQAAYRERQARAEAELRRRVADLEKENTRLRVRLEAVVASERMLA